MFLLDSSDTSTYNSHAAYLCEHCCRANKPSSGRQPMKAVMLVIAGMIFVFAGHASAQQCLLGRPAPARGCATVVVPASLPAARVSPERICRAPVAPPRLCELPAVPRRICPSVPAPSKILRLPVSPRRICRLPVSAGCSFRLPVPPNRFCTVWSQERVRAPVKCR